MALFVGRHVNKIDRKGRVSVPKLYRDSLAEDNGGSFTGFFAFPLFKDPAIEGCSGPYMNRLAKSVGSLDLYSEEQDDFGSILLASAHQLHFDPEGRVSLPAELIEYAGLSDQAAFVGQGERFQIWAPAAYDKHRERAFERARTRGATLKLVVPEEAPS